MNLNLKQIETFVWVADLGSFRKAADRLNTTQPNISNRIAALEQVLNVTLLERDAGSVRLTDRGQQMLQQARAILQSVDAFVAAGNQENLVASVLRLGVTEMVVHTWLREFLRLFKEQFPNVIVELTVDFSRNLDEMLSERSLDITFQSGPFTHSSSAEVALGEYPMIWVASPTTALPNDRPVTSKELLQFPILTHARNTQPFEEVSEHFAKQSKVSARVVASTNLAACLQMTIDGYGVSALLAPMVEREVANGQLFVLDYKWLPSSLKFFARYDDKRARGLVSAGAELAALTSESFAARYR